MNKGRWVDAEPERASACETAFQNGGPRVYAYKDWKQRPVNTSAKQAIDNNDVGESIYSRRKHGQRYVWMKWEMPLSELRVAVNAAISCIETARFTDNKRDEALEALRKLHDAVHIIDRLED